MEMVSDCDRLRPAGCHLHSTALLHRPTSGSQQRSRSTAYLSVSKPCASISLHGWGGYTVANQPPHYTVLLSFTFILPPPRNGVKFHSTCGTESWTELELAFQVLWPSWLDYRVPTTPCTSRLKTKRLKNLSTYQENIAWIKSSCYYSRNIGGTFGIMSPQSKYWGDVSPLSHRDRRPCSKHNFSRHFASRCKMLRKSNSCGSS